MQWIVVIAILAIVLVAVVRWLVKLFGKNREACGGCKGCQLKQECEAHRKQSGN